MRSNHLRRFVVAPLVAVAIVPGIAGCGGSSHPAAASSPSASPSASASPSMSASTSTGCKKLEATLAKASTQLTEAALNPAGAAPKVHAFITALRTAAAGTSPKVKQAVAGFSAAVLTALAQLQKGTANPQTLTTQLTKAAGKITTACHTAG